MINASFNPNNIIPEHVKKAICQNDHAFLNDALDYGLDPNGKIVEDTIENLETGLEAPAIRSHSLLQLASGVGSLQCVESLLNHGADPNLIFNETTALHEAVLFVKRNCVDLLLTNGADPRIECLNHITPLDLAMRDPQIIGLLLGHGAMPTMNALIHFIETENKELFDEHLPRVDLFTKKIEGLPTGPEFLKEADEEGLRDNPQFVYFVEQLEKYTKMSVERNA